MANLLVPLLICATLATAGQAAERPSKKPQPAAKPTGSQVVNFDRDIQPLLGQYCYGCHGETKRKADLSLQEYRTEAQAVSHRQVWEKVLRNVRTREMPPENKPQPTQAERDLIAAWIEAKVFQCDCNHPDPGRVTLRRLNRVEYNNTIRDLIGVDFRPADDFPADDSGYGFDNIGDALSMPPVLLERYLAAAERILDEAIVTEDLTRRRVRRVNAESMDSTTGTESKGDGWVIVGREGELFTSMRFAVPGEYAFRVRAYGEQAGPEPVRMALRIGGKDVKVLEVPQEQNAPKTFEQRFIAPAGVQRCAVAYLNNFRDPKNPDPKQRDRNLAVDYVEFEGPIEPKPQPLPALHERIFTCRAATNAPLEVKLSCAREIIANFAKGAYRRPVQSEELASLAGLAGLALKNGESLESAVKIALQAVLISPHFLFRGELQPHPNNPASVHRIDEYALASRLSYFLWSSMPDRELFAEAERGTLRKHLEAQVRRMLKDSKARALVNNFGGQWLQVRNLDLVTPDSTLFPSFDDGLRAAMRTETELLFETIMREDRDIIEFINADYTFVNARLAHHYGMTNIGGEAYQKVSLRETQRAGVLTHASILTLTSNPTRTSPVKRGKWVLENILGTPPPPPPPDVPELKDAKQLSGTLRQRMEQHRENPACASCHARMDPIGFSFEHFNAIGAWRQKDEELPIDPSGKLVTGESFRDPNELRQILATQKRDEFVRCLSTKMLTYALGRGLEYYDKCATDEIAAHLAKRNYRFSALVMGIVRSTPFQMRRGEGERGELPPERPGD